MILKRSSTLSFLLLSAIVYAGFRTYQLWGVPMIMPPKLTDEPVSLSATLEKQQPALKLRAISITPIVKKNLFDPDADTTKIETVKTVLGDAVDPLAANLLALLATRNLANLVPGIIETFEGLVDSHNGIERAEVITAAPLDQSQEAAVKAVLVKLVDKDVRLSTGVDPNILGGLIARVGDRVIDGSLRTKLQGMRRTVVEQIT